MFTIKGTPRSPRGIPNDPPISRGIWEGFYKLCDADDSGLHRRRREPLQPVPVDALAAAAHEDEQVADVPDVLVVLLGAHIPAQGDAAVRPALQLQEQQQQQWHDGQVVDTLHLAREDHRHADVVRQHDVDLAAALGLARRPGQLVAQHAVLRGRVARRPEVEVRVGGHEVLLELLPGVSVREDQQVQFLDVSRQPFSLCRSGGRTWQRTWAGRLGVP